MSESVKIKIKVNNLDFFQSKIKELNDLKVKIDKIIEEIECFELETELLEFIEY